MSRLKEVLEERGLWPGSKMARPALPIDTGILTYDQALASISPASSEYPVTSETTRIQPEATADQTHVQEFLDHLPELDIASPSGWIEAARTFRLNHDRDLDGKPTPTFWLARSDETGTITHRTEISIDSRIWIRHEYPDTEGSVPVRRTLWFSPILKNFSLWEMNGRNHRPDSDL